MDRKSYIYKYRLNISHTFDPDNSHDHEHSHTFEITMYIADRTQELEIEEFVPYTKVEDRIKLILSGYENKFLNEIKPFDSMVPTVENVGEHFFKLLAFALDNSGYQLQKLMIGETPSQTYIVTPFLMSGDEKDILTTKERNMADYIERMKAYFTYDESMSDDIKIQPGDILIRNSATPEATAMKLEEEKALREQAAGRQLQSGTTIQTASTASAKSESNSTAYTENPGMDSWSQLNANKNPAESQDEKDEKKKETELKDSILSGDKKIKYMPELDRISLMYLPIAACICVFAGILAAYIMHAYGCYPAGKNIYLYLGKADYLYNQLIAGHYAPIYMESWYNGYQMFETTPPLIYYLLALFEWICNGNIILAYLCFVVVMVAVAFFGWYLIGRAYGNTIAGFFAGAIWFILPYNSNVIFSEGNLEYLGLLMIFPYIIWEALSLLNRQKIRYIPCLTLTCLMAVLTDTFNAIILIIALALYIVCYGVYLKRFREIWIALASFTGGIALSLPWLYQASKYGIFSNIYDDTSSFRLGIVVFVAAVFVLLMAGRQTKTACAFCIITGLGSCASLLSIKTTIPMGYIIFNSHYASLFYALLFVAVIQWTECRKWVISLLMLCVVAMVYPGRMPYLEEADYANLYMQECVHAQQSGIEKAYKLTDQRLLIVDYSKNGSFPAYYVSSKGKCVSFTFNLSKLAPAISDNLKAIEYALSQNHFSYVFDRAYEASDDTVAIYKSDVGKDYDTIKKLKAAAEAVGYEFENDEYDYYIFHMDRKEYTGTTTSYENIAIGTSSEDVCIMYPSFEQGYSDSIDDYSVEELKQYKKIFLMGVKYTNRSKAEEKVKELANAGVQVYIDMNDIPSDALTNRKVFLNVKAQTIHFNKKFTNLLYKDNVYKANSFYNKTSNWSTVYLDNLDEIDGYTWVGGKKLSFYGSKGNSNIHFYGFNIIYHALESCDPQVEEILNSTLDMQMDENPSRTLENLYKNFDSKKITFKADNTGINTSLSYLPTFTSNDDITYQDGFIKLNSDKATVYFSYNDVVMGTAYLILLIFMSILSIVAVNYVKKREGYVP